MLDELMVELCERVSLATIYQTSALYPNLLLGPEIGLSLVKSNHLCS